MRLPVILFLSSAVFWLVVGSFLGCPGGVEACCAFLPGRLGLVDVWENPTGC